MQAGDAILRVAYNPNVYGFIYELNAPGNSGPFPGESKMMWSAAFNLPDSIGLVVVEQVDRCSVDGEIITEYTANNEPCEHILLPDRELHMFVITYRGLKYNIEADIPQGCVLECTQVREKYCQTIVTDLTQRYSRVWVSGRNRKK